MTAEAELWQQVARAGGTRLAGYFSGASTGGALLAARYSDDGGQLDYRAYQPLPQGGIREYLVSGVELQADFAAARQFPEGDARSVLEGALAVGEKLAGTLPTSDGATIAAVETKVVGALRMVSMWPDGVGTVVVVPVRPGVPSGCLVEQQSALGSAATLREEPQNQKGDEPKGRPRSRLPLVLGVGALGLVIAAVAANQTGLFGGRPTQSPAVVPETTLVPPPTQESTPPSPNPIPTPAQQPVAVEKGPPPPAPIRKSEPVIEVIPEKPAQPSPRTQDDAVDTRELARLQDLATGTQAYSTVQWATLGASAERLFARLLESKNKGEAARVVLQAYTRAGGDAAACRYLPIAADVSAGERALFREVNKCN